MRFRFGYDGRVVWLILWIAAPFIAVAAAFDLINGFPFGLTYDDAYFYAQIAYNLGQHGRSTFDGFTTTSGYHLLWGGVLGLVSGLLGSLTADKVVHLYVFEVLFVGLALGTARAFHARLLERFCVVAFVLMGSVLMETLLLSCLLLWLCSVEARAGPLDAARVRLAVAAAFLVPIARIDAALILLVYAALLAGEREWRRAGRLALALAAGVVTQLLLMKSIFGHFVSGAALLKASHASPFGPAVWSSLVGPGAPAAGYIVRAVLFAGLGGATAVVGLAERGSAENRRLVYLALGATLFSAAHFVSHVIPFWYYVPAYLTLFYALTHCAVRHPGVRRARQFVVVLLALLGLSFVVHKIQSYRAHLDIVTGARDFAERVKLHVPASGRIYQLDGSGFTGFFAQRSVSDGDGLVNSYEYARRVRAGGLAGVLDEQGICYLIVNSRTDGGVLVDFAGLRVTTADAQEVLRTRAYGRFPTTDFVLYRRIAGACRAPAEVR